jgi:xylan 1,4-beta-xylosidase
MPRHPIQTELVHLRLLGAPVPTIAWVERIDEEHANPRALWHAMGEPEYLSAMQVAQLSQASTLRQEPQPWNRAQESLEFHVSLAAQSVTAITIEFA